MHAQNSYLFSLCAQKTHMCAHIPEASSSFISISNSAVMWDTSFEGDLRPRRRFLDESHLRLTNVTWQLSVHGNWPPERAGERKNKADDSIPY